MILQALQNCKFVIKEDDDSKKQALKAIKAIQESKLLNIERKLMDIFITLRATKFSSNSTNNFFEFSNKLLSYLEECNASIKDRCDESPEAFFIKCQIIILLSSPSYSVRRK